MIVWLASFPRSGNTFLRIALHRIFGVPTYSIYNDDDPVAQRVGPGLVGYRPKPQDRTQMIETSDVYFTKTHKRRKADRFPTIYLVRDGRDAVVSVAHLNTALDTSLRDAPAEVVDAAFRTHLLEAIVRPFDPAQPSSGTWGGNVLNWLDAQDRPLAVLKYDDLIVDPVANILRATDSLQVGLSPRAKISIPSFGDLRGIDGVFFRRGTTRSYRDEMPTDLHDLFWQQPENAEAMQRLGYIA